MARSCGHVYCSPKHGNTLGMYQPRLNTRGTTPLLHEQPPKAHTSPACLSLSHTPLGRITELPTASGHVCHATGHKLLSHPTTQHTMPMHSSIRRNKPSHSGTMLLVQRPPCTTISCCVASNCGSQSQSPPGACSQPSQCTKPFRHLPYSLRALHGTC